MENIFNHADQQDLLRRLEKLTGDTKNVWGTMNAAQMLAHCAKALKLHSEEIKGTPSPMRFIGRLFKNSILGEKPLSKNAPTTLEIKVTSHNDFDFAKEKRNFIEAFHRLIHAGEKGVKAQQHPFLGKLTPQEWGRINYKHLDHHFRQFGI